MKLQSEQRTDVGGRDNNEDLCGRMNGLFIVKMVWVDIMREELCNGVDVVKRFF